MGKAISHVVLSPKLGLTECTDGYWLYDETQGVNIAMRAKTPQDAFVEALGYYQERLTTIQNRYTALGKKVRAFVDDLGADSDDLEL